MLSYRPATACLTSGRGRTGLRNGERIGMLKFSGSSNIGLFLKAYLDGRDDLEGKVVVDIPAGTGLMSAVLQEKGAIVKAYDLFPEFFDVEGLECEAADLQERLPIEDASADIVLCQEGIEHMPDQLAALQEFNRILKPGGTLIITTPSISHLRARMSNVFMESEVFKRMPPNELDALWYSEDGRMYYGHLFLIGIQRLRVLGIAAGFHIDKVHPVRVSTSSFLLCILYPLHVLINAWAYWENMRKDTGVPKETKRAIYREIVRLNLHPTILFGRHLFISLVKTREWRERDLHMKLIK
jgi:SAM-dependent methyltransferase